MSSPLNLNNKSKVYNVHPGYEAGDGVIKCEWHNHNNYATFFGKPVPASNISENYIDKMEEANKGVVLFLNTVDAPGGYDSSFPIPVVKENLDILSKINLDNPFISCFEVPLMSNGRGLERGLCNREDMAYLNDDGLDEFVKKGVISSEAIGTGDVMGVTEAHLLKTAPHSNSLKVEDIRREREIRSEYDLVLYVETCDTTWGGMDTVYNPKRLLVDMCEKSLLGMLDSVPNIQYDKEGIVEVINLSQAHHTTLGSALKYSDYKKATGENVPLVTFTPTGEVPKDLERYRWKVGPTEHTLDSSCQTVEISSDPNGDFVLSGFEWATKDFGIVTLPDNLIEQYADIPGSTDTYFVHDSTGFQIGGDIQIGRAKLEGACIVTNPVTAFLADEGNLDELLGTEQAEDIKEFVTDDWWKQHQQAVDAAGPNI